MDGIIAIPELKDTLGIKEVPEEEQGRYNTLAGMMMLLLQRLPKTGDRVSWENWDFEVADMDGRRIDKVLATLKSSPPSPKVRPKRVNLHPWTFLFSSKVSFSASLKA